MLQCVRKDVMGGAILLTMQPKLIVEQNITFMVNRYRIYSVDAQGGKKELIAFAQQKRFAFKEKMQFYADETKTQASFTLRAEKVMDVHGRFFVEDQEGAVVGTFRKDFAQSLASSTWYIVDAEDKPQLTFTESNKTLAVFRRYLGFVPIVGEFADILMAFLKYHFTVLGVSGQVVGKYQKTTIFRDNYQLSMAEETYNQYDWRVIAAMCVALDALQSR
jgi:uncharacterized protein YxjI